MDIVSLYESMYEELFEEGIEEKIPKLLNFVPGNVENKEEYILWAANTFDPTKNASYITWILRMLKKGVLAGEEDGPKVKERLTQFSELKRKPQFPTDKRDINSFKTYGDLAEVIDEFSGIQTKGEQIRAAREEGIEFIDQLGDTKLYIVTTPEAGAKYFRNTDWCVKDPRYFDNYGPPYYFFTDANDQPETLMHLSSNQTMDVRDRPTDLNDEQQALMSSERMTQYVLDEDGNGLSTYIQKVGPGFDDAIENIFISQAEEAIDNANSDLEMFSIEPFDSYEIEYYQPRAYGGFSYDFTPYEDYINDKDDKFYDILNDVLNRYDIYISDGYNDWDSLFSDDLQTCQISIEYSDNPYEKETITDKIESFVNEIRSIERQFDIEDFDERFKEKLLDAGYISTDWAEFSSRIDLNDLSLSHFKKSYQLPHRRSEGVGNHLVVSPKEMLTKDNDFSRIVGDKELLQTYLEYNRTDHPYVLFTIFLRPLLDNGIQIFIEDGVWIEFAYNPKYVQDKSKKDYMKDLKTLKGFDLHYDFYLEQIREFYAKYVEPYLVNKQETGEFNIPPNLKIPILQIKGRKDNPEQMMLGLHEDRFIAFLRKKGISL